MRRTLVLSLVAAALACAGPPPPEPDAPSPLAFEARAPNGARALLFGSIHVARPNAWSLPEALVRELESADVLVLEVDLASTSAEERLQLMLGLGVMPPGQRLRQVVSDETWQLLEERALESGQSLAQLDRLKPWIVAFQFISFSFQITGFDAEHGVESEVVAGAAPLPVRGLETLYEQLSTFDDLPFPVQDRMLRDALRPTGDQGSDLDALMEAWRRGDARQIEAIAFEDRDDPKLEIFYRETYDRRNARMAEALGEILEEFRRAFVVVGAAHLVGERGIPVLLGESGYRVRQVSGMR